jgi:hypothetical protein
MPLVTSAVKTLLSISQNGINPITLSKQVVKHLNVAIINAAISLSSFSFHGGFQIATFLGFKKNALSTS